MISFKARLHLIALCVLGFGWTFAVSTWAHGQGVVSGPLVPGFDKNPEIAPVTTLNPDFLVPQHSFTYDPTGANVFANALNPVSSGSALGGASGQLDLALRDSTQTAHSVSSRLALLGDSDEDSGTSAIPGGVSRQTGYGMSSSNADFDAGDAGEPNSFDRSSWSGGSSSAFQTSASGWGNKAVHAERMGEDSVSAADDASPGMDSQLGLSSRGGAGSGSRVRGMRSLSSPSANGLGDGPGRGSSQWGAVPGGMASGRISGNAGATITLSRHAGSGHEPLTGDRASGGAGGSSAMALSAEAPQTFERLMIFSPHSYEGYSFGTTPFPSIPSFGDQSFLQPNIFNTTPLGGRARTSSEPGRAALGEGLATSSTKYGIGSNLGAEAARLGSGRSRSNRKRPHLSGNGLTSSALHDAGNSQ
jgi:hypothetical protein